MSKEFDYPLYMKEVDSGLVVMFTSLTGGVVVKQNADFSVGQISKWLPHTDHLWTDVTDQYLDKSPTLEDIARAAHKEGFDVDIEMKPNKDNVNPDHYKIGGIETIDYMRAKATPEEFRGHLRLTALKYLSRYGHKDDTLQELKKAKWYLDRLIEELEVNNGN